MLPQDDKNQQDVDDAEAGCEQRRSRVHVKLQVNDVHGEAFLTDKRQTCLKSYKHTVLLNFSQPSVCFSFNIKKKKAHNTRSIMCFTVPIQNILLILYIFTWVISWYLGQGWSPEPGRHSCSPSRWFSPSAMWLLLNRTSRQLHYLQDIPAEVSIEHSASVMLQFFSLSFLYLLQIQWALEPWACGICCKTEAGTRRSSTR